MEDPSQLPVEKAQPPESSHRKPDIEQLTNSEEREPTTGLSSGIRRLVGYRIARIYIRV